MVISRWNGTTDGEKEELFFNRLAAPLLDEDGLISAIAKPSNHDPEKYSVHLKLTPSAAQRMSLATSRIFKNGVDPKPRMAILIDGKVLIAPNLNDTLRSQIEITGNYTKADAEELADTIKPKAKVD